MPTKLVCAWCKQELGISDTKPLDADITSHGICPVCYHNQMEQVSNFIRRRQ
jgi:hypothetical protein